MEAAALQHYSDRLAQQLVGPHSRRSAIIEEVMDGLQCATEGNLAKCPDVEAAARRAVQEWGSPTEVARAYNDATLRLSANRLSLLAVYVLPLLAFSWAYALLSGPSGPWVHHPPMLTMGLSVATIGVVLCLGGALSGLRRGTGMQAAVGPRDRTVTLGTLAAVVGMLCVLGALVVLLLNRGISHPESLDWPLISIPAALSVLAGVYFVLSLKRFLAILRAAGSA
ncbi:hypothetical protein ACNAW0_07715 [Micromonospora sp. SL1-18]|uniref:hypothetical protein n=1 Tax=Micromonospora sp. SL1-18 TaxID=3399128 RepID=UPI003A4DCC2B